MEEPKRGGESDSGDGDGEEDEAKRAILVLPKLVVNIGKENKSEWTIVIHRNKPARDAAHEA
ncbi:hypothetical protein AMTR_s00086p00018420 [Amborella trichopoda]|uniref:Uncharacterized protein n=1 Tax=Amborella trichopoda TaxID=13333 RepID=W1NYS5_AMBTC|nr:hypothetical protein AMTR_s00086p00018420 [Amborella trichopoda]